MESFFRFLFEKSIQEYFVYKEPCVLKKKKKMKSEMKWNSEHFFELATLEINARGGSRHSENEKGCSMSATMVGRRRKF